MLPNWCRARLAAAGRRLARLAPPPPRAHPLDALAAAGGVHLTAQYRESTVHMAGPQTRITLGPDSILLGRVVFHRPGRFVLGARSYVGADTAVHITTAVEIGDDAMISWGCTLLDTDMHALDFVARRLDVLIAGGRRGLSPADKDWSTVRCAPIVVGDKAWVGAHALLLPGVTLGAGCIVGAGSVVTRDVPPWTLAAGNPARVIRALESDPGARREARRAPAEGAPC